MELSCHYPNGAPGRSQPAPRHHQVSAAFINHEKKLVLYGQKGEGGGNSSLEQFVPKDVFVEFCPVAHAPQTAPQMDEVPWHLLNDKPVTPIVEGNLET